MAAVADHRHCKVCGKVCDPDEDTCSRTCADVRESRLRARRNYAYLLYGALALLLVVFLSRFIP